RARGAGLEPGDRRAAGEARGELRLGCRPSLAEVGPALVVDRDNGRRGDPVTEVGCFGAGHRVAERATDREADAAEVDDRGADVEAVGDLGDAGVEDGVAGDPELARGLALPAETEADHVADDRLAQRRPGAAGRRGD